VESPGYANKQAVMCERLAAQCALHWLPQLEAKGVTPSWGADYKALLDQVQSEAPAQANDESEVEDLVSDEELVEFDEDVDEVDSDDDLSD